MQKKATDTIPKILVEKTVIPQANIVKASSATNNAKPAVMETKNNHTANIVSVAPKKVTIIPIKETRNPVAPDLSKASLLDAFVTVATGMSSQTFPVTSGDNKDADTHWSCGTFDQNGRPVTSFHDDSNSDEYAQGSITGPLQMHIDNAAAFGDFSNGGHLHINIAPNGNDTWGITQFTLALDFLNPNSAQKITWQGFTLSQDKRDIDLYFMYDGKNLVVRQ